jgi:formylglycine-generating enzyme required for sulfatase activity
LQSIPGAAAAHPVPAPEEYREPVPTALRTRLPLLVPLRDFSKDMDCRRGRQSWLRSDLERALAAWVDGSPPPGLTGALLKDHLAAGSAFLLMDGLDEVAVSERREGTTVYPRALLLSGLADAQRPWQIVGNRILLTSRPYGLGEAGLAALGLARAPLDPLPEPLQELFVTRWFHMLSKPDLAGELLEAMADREDLAPLTENPMLLTSICVLYDKGGRLPEDRYELYKSIVDGVLHNRYPGDAREREPVLRRLEAIARGMHTGEPGGAPRPTPAAEISWVETERILADFAERNPALGRGEVDAAIQREELLTRSGLLVPRPNERVAFYHLSFQEFLAAQRVARGSDTQAEEAFRGRATVPEWHPTLLFLFAAQVFNKDPGWGFELLARLLASQDPAAVKANPAPALLLAEALDLSLAKGYRVPKSLTESFHQLVLHASEDEIEVQDRQALGLCLGRLGDPRVFDLRDPKAYVEVPAGRYPYGDKGETVEIRAPFWIGRYPVTNGQYLVFMAAGGYNERKWWSDAGWAWLQDAGRAQLQKRETTEPRFWRDRGWNGPSQPVVGVSFFEAEACCAWAGGRLPSEQEWEAAGRGPKGHVYPWGDEWEDGICNTREASLEMLSPIGLFPRSRQAELGIEDLAGNVFEWCRSLDKNPKASGMVRGGAWFFDQDDARSGRRARYDPTGSYDIVGFRVVCSSPI